MAHQHPSRSHATGRPGSRAARERSAARAARRGVSGLLGNASFVLLGLAVLAIGATLAIAARHLPASSASSQAASQPSGTLQEQGDWIPLRSTAPADIIAAARQSALFQQNTGGTGDHVSNLSRLGTPVLVHAVQPPGAAAGQYPDFYVLPILNGAGAATDAAELQLNPAHTAIHVIAIVTYAQPHAHGAIAHMDASAARASLNAQRHVAARAGTSPWLVYFPADADAQEKGEVTWTGGGEFPADPIWLIPGADGRDHLVGVDGHAYEPSQLPTVRPG